MHNLCHHAVGAGGDLRWCLILNGMGDVDGIVAGTSERAGLHAGGSDEFSRGHGHCRNAKVL